MRNCNNVNDGLHSDSDRAYNKQIIFLSIHFQSLQSEKQQY